MLDLLAIFAKNPHVETAVRATLADGQVLMGDVRTRVLRLATGAGLVEVPLADVGEVVPAAREGLQVSEGVVNVWLRNGSELRGTWSDPALAMGIKVGGGVMPVDLPMNELTRFQLHSREAWPAGPVYRMKTTWGDDLLVDPTKTHLVVQNQLGTFAPSLAECRSLHPITDPEGDWRIELATGTVLIGKLQDKSVAVSLPMGPDEFTVPLANFVSLTLESWSTPTVPVTLPLAREVRDDRMTVEAAPRLQPRQPQSATGQDESGDWFDRGALDATKSAQQAPDAE